MYVSVLRRKKEARRQVQGYRLFICLNLSTVQMQISGDSISRNFRAASSLTRRHLRDASGTRTLAFYSERYHKNVKKHWERHHLEQTAHWCSSDSGL